ncbi:hypothetical protein LCGC14_1979280 [marine sediment metagenome]|uniref:Uncharacterized protein n=1 Tax=marine sediment metagenome TaxID=412755 RepID=A0A0F9F9S2_9ZZZZ
MKPHIKKSVLYTSIVITFLTIFIFVIPDAHPLFKILFLALTFDMIYTSHGIMFYRGAIHGVDQAVEIMEKGQSTSQKKPRGEAS